MTAYEDWFGAISGNNPYSYQSQIAASDVLPDIVAVPTGAGKTAAIILAWLWRLRHASPEVQARTPRRLVYCLPRRALVTQVAERTDAWLKADGPTNSVRLEVVMGGHRSQSQWWTRPEQPAILVGTAEMLLSRALNRGYASPRNRWPREFGLLNNDSLWVIDEVQLYADGLPTTVQLAGLRTALGHYGPSHTIWMSATPDPSALETPDRPKRAWNILRLSNAEIQESEELRRRMQAPKRLEPYLGETNPHALAVAIAQSHQPRSLTLVICNTPRRATDVYDALPDGVDRCLVHGQFRLAERDALARTLYAPVPDGGRIAVCTQVVEAGMDLDARTLWTELAPWSSLVQRFGRCNRAGHAAMGRVVWVDTDDPGPYAPEDLSASRDALKDMQGRSVSPVDLGGTGTQSTETAYRHVLRRADLLGLFDTSADLSGNDLDVSRFIQAEASPDVYVFWRNDPPTADEAPFAEELCPISVKEVRDFLRKRPATGRGTAYRYDHLVKGRWEQLTPDDLRPGHVVLILSEAGGYQQDRGWTGDPQHAPVRPIPPNALVDTGDDDHIGAESPYKGPPQQIVEHSNRVRQRLEKILADLPGAFRSTDIAALRLAAWWHDVGKAHPVFQKTMRACGAPDDGGLWAKIPSHSARHCRRHFRHELASLLLFLQAHGWRADQDVSLPAYLVLSHHGKARLAVRAFPDESSPEGSRCVLGVRHGDCVPGPIDLGGGLNAPGGLLELDLFELGLDASGRPSWIDRALALRDAPHLGPFRLAFLEATLRAADARADEGSRPMLKGGASPDA